MTEADYRHKLRCFIEDRFLVTFDEDFPENTDLFREGVMDSFGYVQLHRFIEREFGVAFTEADLKSGLLVSLTQTQEHVARRLGLQSGVKT